MKAITNILQSLKGSLVICTILALSLSSCDFLSQEPQTSLSPEQLVLSIDNMQPYINGIYYSWRDTRINRKGFFLMLGLDETQQGEYQVRTDAQQAALDKYDGFYSPDNNAIAQLWSVRWRVAVLASEALYNLKLITPTTKQDSTLLNSLTGQALFYRASVMLEMAQYWGGLPIPTIEGGTVVTGGRETLLKTYQLIETDLLTAIELLPETRPSDGRIPTKWAAHTILARLYMSAWEDTGFRSYSKAKKHLQAVVDSGVYSLMPNYADLWNPEVSCEQEAIFTFYFNNVWPDTNELQWYTGSRAVSSDPNCAIGGYDLLIPTAYARSYKTDGGIWEEGDLRRDESIRYDFKYKGKSPAQVAGFGEDQLLPHIKKYEDWRIDGEKSFYETGKYVYYIRYADVLLLLAECMNETDSTAQAVALVNQVRTRAWDATLSATAEWSVSSKEEFRKNLMDERIRELLCEGWRRMDLMRQGKQTYITEVKDKNPWAKANATLDEHHLLFPIPNTEIKTNTSIDILDQNPGY